MRERIALKRSSIKKDSRAVLSDSRGLNLSVPAMSSDTNRKDEILPSHVSSSDRDVLYQLWDEVLDILFERIERRYVPMALVKHLVPELRQLLSSAKGQKFLTNSVVNLIMVMIEGDATAGELRLGMHCSESTIYRALAKLERIGFLEPAVDRQNPRRWTIARKSFPILYCASRV